STVAPMIAVADMTKLTNISVAKKPGPIYVTIGNIILRKRNSATKICVWLVPLIMWRPKFTGELGYVDEP
ncbi:hypothetical protein B9Z19DRAFT_979498, partial [Tuber borchii]